MLFNRWRKYLCRITTRYPGFIEIDVKDLNLDDKICVGDLKFPEGIETEFEADK